MASGTFKLPSGSKIRTGSSRRFVVVVEFVPGKPFVDYRTDELGRAWARIEKRNGTKAAVIVDTIGRKVSGPGGGHTWVDA